MSKEKSFSGKYIGYLTTIESSNIIWSDDIEEIKKEWYFGIAIFENDGIDYDKLKKIFPEPPGRGVILDYLIENLKVVHQDGVLISKINPKRETLIEKTK